MGTKIIITGATGYIGKHVIAHLSKLGYEVEAMTRADLLAENFHQLAEANTLIHCAWPTKIDLHATDHLEFAELTCHLFEECSKNGVRVINLGSSSEYGAKNEPMREDMICEPHTTYGIAKLAVTLFAKKLGFNTLRLFTVYGNGGNSFADSYEKSDKYTSPYFVRSLTHINDLCGYIERILHAKHIYGEIFNCPALEERKYHQVVAGYNGKWPQFDVPKDSRWNKYPQRQFEPPKWQCNSTKFYKTFAL